MVYLLYNVKYFYSGADVLVMDENAKEQFKWKFYHLTIEINGIVLLVAVSVLVLLLIHSPYTVPLVLALLAIAFIVSRDLIRRYRETKMWLDNHTENEREQKEETR